MERQRQFQFRVLLAALLPALLAFAPAAPAAAQSQAQPQAQSQALAIYQDGDLLQAQGDDKLYLVEAGQRHWIADTTSLQRLSPEPTRLRRVSFDELDRIPPGRPYRQFPLIRDDASGRVYLLTKEIDWPAPRKHWINDLNAFAQLGFTWGDIAQDWPQPPAQYADAPTLTYRPVSREQTTYTDASGTFSYVPAWRLQVEDERLLQGLILANTYNPDWRAQVAPGLATAGTWIEWGDLPDSVGGVYRPRLNRITINRTLGQEAFGVLATVLAHEVFHAVTTHGSDSAACFAEETQAFTWEAMTWANLPPQWRSHSQMAQMEDTLVTLWHRQALSQLVSSDTAYQRECA